MRISAPGPTEPGRGFTLVEMLVAFAIFSLAALALLRLGVVTASQSGRLESRALAQIDALFAPSRIAARTWGSGQ